MIPVLYTCFHHWSKNGSIYLISDTHFDDADGKIMDRNWISPEEHIKIIKKSAHKCDTLIHLGDVGNPEYLQQIKAHKVLIMGNHDQTDSKFKPFFNEIYAGPLMIAEKIILSHEPIENIDWAYNIHGHDHNPRNHGDLYHLNLAANVVGFQVQSLSEIIKAGALSNVKSLHRSTIDTATHRKKRRASHELQGNNRRKP